MAYGEVNPHDRQNRVIVDIELAPRNARGNVEYAFNFYILKPIDLKKGARKMMYEPPNRGGKTWAALGRIVFGPGGAQRSRPRSSTRWCWRTRSSCRAATPWSWSGWEHDLGHRSTAFNATAQFPIAKNRDGIDDHRPVVRVHRDRRRLRRRSPIRRRAWTRRRRSSRIAFT